MTFTEIVQAVMDRCDLTSSDATARVGRTVNSYYKRVTSSLGLQAARRVTVQQNATPGVRYIVFSGIEKVLSVQDRSVTPTTFLKMVSVEEIDDAAVGTGQPTMAAIYNLAAQAVTVYLNTNPQTAFTLYAEGYDLADVLAGSQTPLFPESFHDVLVEGAIIDERLKQEKLGLAEAARETYESRLSDLRMFLQTSAYQDIHQGKRAGALTTSGGSSGSSSTPNGAASYTQTGLITFDRDPSAPFAVTSGSATVPNLDADLLDGKDWNTAGALPDGGLGLTDVTTNNVTSTKHGFAPKSPATAGKFLNGAATPGYAYPSDTVVDSTATGTQNNWAPGLAGYTLITWHGASAMTVTGLAGGVAGQRVTFKNTGTQVATFSHNSGSSSAGNKLFNQATSAGTPVAGNGSVTYEYDGTQWQMVAHDQGAWITPTFAAGDFTASGAQTWTLSAGDRAAVSYRLRGQELMVAVILVTTTVGGTPASDLRIGNGQWGGFTIASTVHMGAGRVVDAGTVVAAFFQADPSSTFIRVLKTTQANWSAATDTTEVDGTITFPVT